jgi:Arm domain-containing DNA-binding protein/integrase-like protein
VLAKITKRTVDGLLVPRGGRECVLWDSEIKGFGIRARRGGTKTYILHYRAGKGRAAPLRKITIGKHGSPWTPDTARIEAKRLMGQVAGGGDPCRDRAIEKKAMAFSELCDLYLVEGTAHKKPSTIRNDKARIEHHIKPLIGRKRVDAVTRGDIERLLVDVKGGTSARRQTRSEKRRAGGLPKGGAGAAAQCVTLDRYRGRNVDFVRVARNVTRPLGQQRVPACRDRRERADRGDRVAIASGIAGGRLR